MLRSTALCMAAALALVLPRPAAAEDPLSTARTALAQARFEQALQQLDEVERAGGLGRAEAASLLEMRALAHYAMLDEARMRESLSRLAALHPDHRLGADVPPDVRAAFEREKGGAQAPRLSVDASEVDNGVQLEVDVVDPTGLLQNVRLGARPEGASWAEVGSRSLRVAADPGTILEYYATGLGPGDVAVVRRGSPDEPLQFRLDPAVPRSDAASAPRPAAARPASAPDDEGRRPWVPVLAAGAGVAVAAAVTVAVLLLRGSGNATDVERPSFAWPES